jgi:YVTN family beta-propeller protein
MYIINFDSDTISVINTNNNTLRNPIPVGDGPEAIAFDSVHNSMYVTNLNSKNVYVISTDDSYWTNTQRP